jgi:hypothetical protein|tara:strand:- start:4184 stop:5536 length:1353 start_codon:yes stop_codon:yes gene_type:complete
MLQQARTRYLLISLLYVGVLSWIYLTEMIFQWSYMGLVGALSFEGVVGILFLSTVIAVFTPNKRDVRSYVIATLNFIFFYPSIVFLCFAPGEVVHFLMLFLVFGLLVVVSNTEITAPQIAEASPSTIMLPALGLTIFAVVLQAAFGGLTYFNLDIERVYDFRRVAARELPGIFDYLYSNVSTAVMPVALLLALKFRNWLVVGLVLFCTVLLFGMTQHKSVLFAPWAVVALYYFYGRTPQAYVIGYLFMGVLGLCTLELIRIDIAGTPEAGYLTSLVVRRVLLIPAVLDSYYIEFFSINEFYYWSSSRLGFFSSGNDYIVSAPFVIGETYFSDPDMSANAGLIGSGFSNAGIIGVAAYGLAAGLILSMLQSYGKRIGHAFVSAVSILTVFNIITSTDILTSLLTHGLLMLIILLSFFNGDGTLKSAARIASKRKTATPKAGSANSREPQPA